MKKLVDLWPAAAVQVGAERARIAGRVVGMVINEVPVLITVPDTAEGDAAAREIIGRYDRTASRVGEVSFGGDR